jgi:DNA-binding NtrC family response regulator
LEGVLRESVLFAKRDVLEPEDLLIKTQAKGDDYFELLPDPEPGFDLKAFLARARGHLIRKALSVCQGNQSQAAALLGITKQAISEFLSSSPDNPS